MATNYYTYSPSHVAPIVFACLVGLSWIIHIWQNFRYRSWKVMFFMVWGGAVFMTGWIMRSISAYHPTNLAFYASQSVLILCGPPIYSAAEYNVLGRLMHYLPMHAPLNPNRVVYFFIYLGAAVEGLTAAGAARISVASGDDSKIRSGGRLVLVALILQAIIEGLFMCMVGLMHYRSSRSKQKVGGICSMLYGTSFLVLLRCVCRVVEQSATLDVLSTDTCNSTCRSILRHEWFLYVFEAVPMVLYTYWLNVMHPGRLIPTDKNCYLDVEGTVRVGPGWIDNRSQWATFVDPFDFIGILNGNPAHEKFWLQPSEWPVAVDRGRAKRNMRRSDQVDVVEEGVQK